jgi:hypothetical protein
MRRNSGKPQLSVQGIDAGMKITESLHYIRIKIFPCAFQVTVRHVVQSIVQIAISDDSSKQIGLAPPMRCSAQFGTFRNVDEAPVTSVRTRNTSSTFAERYIRKRLVSTS